MSRRCTRRIADYSALTQLYCVGVAGLVEYAAARPTHLRATRHDNGHASKEGADRSDERSTRAGERSWVAIRPTEGRIVAK